MAASKMEGFRAKMGSNVGESIGANRQPRPALQTATPAGGDPFEGTTRRATARTIPLDKIEPDPDQPRKTFDQASLLTMASSLLAHGQLQAIKVRRDTSTARFLIISGERRYRASILAGLKTIEADVIEDNDSARVFIKQLVENCVREDMAPLDQARAFRKAIDTAGSEFDTAAKLAAELGLSEASVSRSLSLLNLPESVQAMVVAKTTDATKEKGGKPTITPTQAYEISKAPPEMQEALAAQIIAEKLTVMETARVVSEAREQAKVIAAEQGGTTDDEPSTKATRRTRLAPAKSVAKREYKGPTGLKITAMQPKGLDLLNVAEALETFASEIRAELAEVAEVAVEPETVAA